MSSRCLEGLLLLACGGAAAAAPPLRVCADLDAPAFEQRVAERLAAALQRPLEVLQAPWRHGFVRKTAGLCEVFVGVPAGFAPLATTRPYYRAGWVAVTRAADPAPLRSVDDPRLAQLHLGIVLPAGDGALTPVGDALVRRGAYARVHGYPVAAQPLARLLADLREGRIDAALLWAPQAAGVAGDLAVHPLAGLPEVAVAVGVRRGDAALLAALDQALDTERPALDALLAEAGVLRSDRR